MSGIYSCVFLINPSVVRVSAHAACMYSHGMQVRSIWEELMAILGTAESTAALDPTLLEPLLKPQVCRSTVV